MKIFKNFSIILAITLFLVVLTEIGLRCLYYQYRYHSHNRTSIIDSPFAIYQTLLALQERARSQTTTSTMVSPSDLFSLKLNTGKHKVRYNYQFLKLGSLRSKDVIYTITKEGTRSTGIDYNRLDKPDIYIFGCSFTFGATIDDKFTFPWILQSKLRDSYDIVNYGIGGFGTIHSYLQIRHLLKNNKIPKYIVLVFNEFHMNRNVASPHRLAFSATSLLRAEFDKNQLKIITIDPIPPNINQPNFSYDHKKKITLKLISEIKSLCDKNNVTLVIGIQTPLQDISFLNTFDSMGVSVVDMSLKLTRKYRQLPFDPHPNEKANKHYAKALISFFEKTL